MIALKNAAVVRETPKAVLVAADVRIRTAEDGETISSEEFWLPKAMCRVSNGRVTEASEDLIGEKETLISERLVAAGKTVKAVEVLTA